MNCKPISYLTICLVYAQTHYRHISRDRGKVLFAFVVKGSRIDVMAPLPLLYVPFAPLLLAGAFVPPQRRGQAALSTARVVEEDVVEALEEDEDDYEFEIFCNRELNMKDILAVGFDMDYTLAQYNVEFDLLAFEGAKEKLVNLGYPREVLDFEFDPETHMRGLVIDKARGNILKVDRHKYCRRAFHGTRELTPEERKRNYIGVADETPTFTGDDYVNVDSLFQVIDASLYAQLVDLSVTDNFRQAYKDVRHAVDLCHHDGVIKDRVAEDPAKYILPDEDLVPMLTNFRAAGKKTFCVTNSLFDYTNVVMNFLTGSEVDGRDWIDLFDVVVVGAGKPAFLSPDYRDLLRVDVTSNRGTLHNLRGAPVREVGPEAFLAREGKVFQGGTYRDLHAMLSLESGSQLLYVGDHIYSDVLRSKRSLGWRTALIIPELEHELRVSRASADKNKEIVGKVREYEVAEGVADQLRLLALEQAHNNEEGDTTQPERNNALIAEAEARRARAREALRDARKDLHADYHETWGSLFRAGHIASRFGKQVVDYACIYTSRCSNLIRTSPSRHFRPQSDSLPHDFEGA